MCTKYPYPNCPIMAGNHRHDVGFTGIHRGQALTVVGARVHGPQKPLRSVWQAPKPWAPLKATISSSQSSHSRSRSLWFFKLCKNISTIFKVWKADGCWQSDSMLTVIMRFCKDWFLRFRWTQTAAASLLVLVIESHSLVFRRPCKSKNIIGKWRTRDYIEKAPHERNWQTTMSQSIDPLGFCRWKMKPPLASFVTRLNMGLCNASSSADLWICLFLLHKYVMATRDLSNFIASGRLQEGICCWIKLSKFQQEPFMHRAFLKAKLDREIPSPARKKPDKKTEADGSDGSDGMDVASLLCRLATPEVCFALYISVHQSLFALCH